MDKSTMNTFELIEFVEATTKYKGESAVMYALSVIWNLTESRQKERVADTIETYN
jgi:hypothetical protein